MASTFSGLPPSWVARNAVRASAGPDGRLELPIPPPCFVAARAAGSAPGGVLVEESQEGAAIALPPEQRLAGRVQDYLGESVAGAEITGCRAIFDEANYRDSIENPLERIAGMLFTSHAVAAPDGSFELDGLPAARVALVAALRDRCSEREFRWVLPTDDPIVLYLRPVVPVSGLVLAATSGLPLDAVRVTAWYRDGGLSIRETAEAYSAQDGTFSIGVPAADPRTDLRFVRDGYAVSLRALERADRDRGEPVVVRMPEACVARGTARTTSGSPLAGAWVQAQSDENLDLLSYTQADSNGAFALDGIAPGAKVAIALSAPRHYQVLLRGVDLCAASPIELRADPLATLRGSVVADGPLQPDSRARIVFDEVGGVRSFEDQVAVDSVTGAFLFEALTAGTYQLDVIAPGFAPARIYPLPVVDGVEGNSVEVRLDRGATVTGRVTERSSGRAVAGARVALSDINTAGRHVGPLDAGRSAETDVDGRFALEHVPVGCASGLIVEREGFAQGVAALALAPGQQSGHADVSLLRSASITSVAEDELGREIQDIGIFMRCPDGTTRNVETKDGTVVLEGLPPGRTEVQTIVGAGYRSDLDNRIFRQVIELGEGETRALRHTLAEGGTVRGRVDGLGTLAAVRYVWVFVAPPAPPLEADNMVLVSDRGDYALPGIPAGPRVVTLRYSDQGRSFQLHRRVEVVAGAAVEVDFSLSASAFRGRILGSGGAPLAAVRIRVRGESPPEPDPAVLDLPDRESHSDETGVFEVGSLDPGAYRFDASRVGFGTVSGRFDLAGENAIVDRDVVLEPEALLDVSITDRSGAALADALCRARSADPNALEDLEGKRGDGPGTWHFTGAGAGDVTLDVTADGHFPSRSVIDCVSGTTAVARVVLRRLGEVRIQLELPDGSAAARIPFTMVDVESGTPVGDWIAEGRVSSTTAGQETDAAGRAVLRGLPEGTYALRGTGFSAEVEAVPGASAEFVRVAMLR